jgi:hypothetical protein
MTTKIPNAQEKVEEAPELTSALDTDQASPIVESDQAEIIVFEPFATEQKLFASYELSEYEMNPP